LLSYSDLTKSQRKWVDLVELHFPEIDTQLTFEKIKEIRDLFKSKQELDKRYKGGYALWLITHNAIDRGPYMFPGSKFENVEPIIPVIDSELETRYKNELIKYGISYPK
jgi:hypothetical protein